MSRPADPERIYQARRSGTFRRLVDVDHFEELKAEHWMARWEREVEASGAGRFAPEFWQEGETRIVGQCRSARQ